MQDNGPPWAGLGTPGLNCVAKKCSSLYVDPVADPGIWQQPGAAWGTPSVHSACSTKTRLFILSQFYCVIQMINDEREHIHVMEARKVDFASGFPSPLHKNGRTLSVVSWFCSPSQILRVRAQTLSCAHANVCVHCSFCRTLFSPALLLPEDSHQTYTIDWLITQSTFH